MMRSNGLIVTSSATTPKKVNEPSLAGHSSAHSPAFEFGLIGAAAMCDECPIPGPRAPCSARSEDM